MSEKAITIDEFRAAYDWREVLGYAGKDPCLQGRQDPPMAAPPTDDTMDRSAFGMDDVAEVLHAVEGESEGPNWICALRLKDGRFAYIEAGCDYTGWDCQAGGSASVARTLDDLVTFGMPENARERFGLRSGAQP